MEPIFSAGYGRRDITPDWSVPLAGNYHSERRMNQSVGSPIMASCVALCDGETTLLWYSLDICRPDTQRFGEVRRSISEATGVPFENIFTCCTHTHSSIDPSSPLDAVKNWYPVFTQKMIEAAKDAIRDLAPAKAFAGEIETHEMVFTRRYYLKDGSFCGLAKGTPTEENPLVCHETPADPMLEVVRFEREGRRDIVMMNFGVHVTRCSGKDTYYMLTADWPGEVRRQVEEQANCHFIYFNSGEGNTVAFSRLKWQEMDHYPLADYCPRMTGYVLRALKWAKPVQTGKIRVQNYVYPAEVDHTMDDRIEDAKKVMQIWEDDDREAAFAAAKECGFSGYYQAMTIEIRYNKPKFLDMELCTATFGDLGLAAVPYEMFCDTSREIKDQSPCKHTFVCSCTQGFEEYVPTYDAFPNGGYEVESCRFFRGQGEKFRDKLLEMLKEG